MLVTEPPISMAEYEVVFTELEVVFIVVAPIDCRSLWSCLTNCFWWSALRSINCNVIFSSHSRQTFSNVGTVT